MEAKGRKEGKREKREKGGIRCPVLNERLGSLTSAAIERQTMETGRGEGGKKKKEKKKERAEPSRALLSSVITEKSEKVESTSKAPEERGRGKKKIGIPHFRMSAQHSIAGVPSAKKKKGRASSLKEGQIQRDVARDRQGAKREG